jgi:membrane protease YdiL (CAAX protease family)
MQDTSATTATSSDRADRWTRGSRRIAAIVEVMGLLAAADLAVYYFHFLPHVPDVGYVMRAADAAPGRQGVYVAFSLLLHLAFKGAALFALVLLVGWLRRYRDPFRYGLSKRGRPAAQWVALGVLGFCVASLPTKMLAYASHFHLFAAGGGSDYYRFLRHAWSPAFWVIELAAMCVIAPLAEEFFFRGYAQTRLELEWGAPAAIVIVSLFFTARHLSGYLYHLGVGNVTQLVFLWFGAICLGIVYWRTRSLLPGVVMHGLGNVPVHGFPVYVGLTLAMGTLLIVFRRRWIAVAVDFVRRVVATPAVAIPTAACGVALTAWSEIAGLRMTYILMAGLLVTLLVNRITRAGQQLAPVSIE